MTVGKTCESEVVEGSHVEKLSSVPVNRGEQLEVGMQDDDIGVNRDNNLEIQKGDWILRLTWGLRWH